MATFLKQSTAIDVSVGPFVAAGDGVTPQTGLTITQPDIRLKKNGGAWAQKNAAQTLSHEENGWYEIALDTTDTNTLGNLLIAVNESGALPVWREFQVMPANVWDSLFGADKLQVHVDEMTAGIITATVVANGTIDAATFAAGAIDAAALAADAVTAIAAGVWDEDATGHQIAGSFGQVIGDNHGLDSIYDIVGNTPTAAGVAFAVWDEALADHSGTAGSTAEALAAIDAKTTNLPSDPADASVIAARLDTVDTNIAAVPAAILAADFEQDGEAGINVAEGLRVVTAALAGKLSGAGTGTETVRNFLDTKDRITYTVDTDGNRSAVTTDLT